MCLYFSNMWLFYKRPYWIPMPKLHCVSNIYLSSFPDNSAGILWAFLSMYFFQFFNRKFYFDNCRFTCDSWIRKVPWRRDRLPTVVFTVVFSFLGGSDGKESACSVGDLGLIPGWQPIPVFLPGESPWIEEPGGLQSMGSQRVVHNWAINTHKHVLPKKIKLYVLNICHFYLFIMPNRAKKIPNW